MTRNKLLYPLILLTVLLTIGWGSVGHRIISKNIQFSTPPELSFLSDWPDSLAAHSSDADKRKSSDPDEYPKHFIDIDYYSQFLVNGNIIEDFDSLVSVFGHSVVLDQGILPWVIIETYDSLTACFSRKEWHKAMLFASDLGHYVADAHMPLHITRNYNGQLTNQTGIHSRYESQMISRYSSQITYQGEVVDTIPDIQRYVFDFIYGNYSYVDSVLNADNLAKSVSGGVYSDYYYQKLWEYSKQFTIQLYANASVRLTELIFNAWLEAGSPVITDAPTVENNPQQFQLHQNYPNPFNPGTTIKYTVPNSLKSGEHVKLSIIDITGKETALLVNEIKSPGNYQIYFNGSGLASGIYLYKLTVGVNSITKKMLLLK